MEVYQYSLADLPQDTFEHSPLSIAFGDYELVFKFSFPEYEYNDYNNYLIMLSNMSSGDPLCTSSESEYIRDYDWLEFYKSAEATSEWLNTAELLPVSIRRLSSEQEKLNLITLNKNLALLWEDVLKTQYTLLRWFFSAEYLGETLCTGYVQKGGVYEIQNPEFQFSFISDFVSEIGFQDLPKVVIQFEVKDV